MNRSGGEAFAKLAQQLNRARLQAQGGGGGKGGGQMPGFKGFMAGGGLLAVLAGGGLILNYSLFNGMFLYYPSASRLSILMRLRGKRFVHGSPLTFSRWWSSSDQVFKITWYPIRYLPRRYSFSGMSSLLRFITISPSPSSCQVTMTIIGWHLNLENTY